MIALISYFIVPTAIFLTLVKLNHKRRWLTARLHGGDYFTKSGKDIDKIIFWAGVALFFAIWPVALPILLIILGILWFINYITNGEGAIPLNKPTERESRY
jgi:hypothetical protein